MAARKARKSEAAGEPEEEEQQPGSAGAASDSQAGVQRGLPAGPSSQASGASTMASPQAGSLQ